MFRSLDHALLFAFTVTEHPILQQTQMQALAGATMEKGAQLSSHEWHAQAALIRARVDRVLPPVHAAYVRASFGYHDGRLEDVRIVARSVRSTLRGADRMPAGCIDAITLRCLSVGRAHRPTEGAIGRAFSVHPRKVSYWARRVGEVLEVMDARVDAILGADMECSGLIRTSNAATAG